MTVFETHENMPPTGKKAADIAVHALSLAVLGMYDQAYAKVQAIAVEYPQFFALAVQVWVDAYIEWSFDGYPEEELARAAGLVYWNVHDGAMTATEPSDVTVAQGWAVDVIRARMVSDIEWFKRLWVDGVSGSTEDFAARVVAVLDIVSMTVRGMERGYARRLGKDPWITLN